MTTTTTATTTTLTTKNYSQHSQLLNNYSPPQQQEQPQKATTTATATTSATATATAPTAMGNTNSSNNNNNNSNNKKKADVAFARGGCVVSFCNLSRQSLKTSSFLLLSWIRRCFGTFLFPCFLFLLLSVILFENAASTMLFVVCVASVARSCLKCLFGKPTKRCTFSGGRSDRLAKSQENSSKRSNIVTVFVIDHQQQHHHHHHPHHRHHGQGNLL